MRHTDPRVDAYINNAAPFARPILRRVRAAFHNGCPAVVETIKWGMPFFEYRGALGGMAAFKRHATFGLWKATLLKDPLKLFRKGVNSPMGAGHIKSVTELPPEAALVNYVKAAAKLNEQGVNVERVKRAKPALKTPPALTAALRKNKKAAATFKNFSPGCRREYIEWIVEAKRPETRAKRIATTVQWLARGKRRNWKYER